ncbi:hypothetical protein NYO67_9602 [Aspergillus flavus]|nr:hypothetical protein NYO67_9602 [Aspergillus flavus]
MNVFVALFLVALMGCPLAQAMPINGGMAQHFQPSLSAHAGLAVGLGVGMPFLCLVAIFIWRYNKNAKREENRARDEWLRDLSLTTQRRIFWSPLETHLACHIKRPVMAEKDPGSVQKPPKCVVKDGRLLLCACHQPRTHDAEIRRAEIRHSVGAGGMYTILE